MYIILYQIHIDIWLWARHGKCSRKFHSFFFSLAHYSHHSHSISRIFQVLVTFHSLVCIRYTNEQYVRLVTMNIVPKREKCSLCTECRQQYRFYSPSNLCQKAHAYLQTTTTSTTSTHWIVAATDNGYDSRESYTQLEMNWILSDFTCIESNHLAFVHTPNNGHFSKRWHHRIDPLLLYYWIDVYLNYDRISHIHLLMFWILVLRYEYISIGFFFSFSRMITTNISDAV